MAAKTLYHYSPIDYAFTHETVIERDQFDEIWVIPFLSTTIAPVKNQKGFVNIFDEKKSEWSLVEDYQDKIFYDKETGGAVDVKSFADITEKITEKERPNHYFTWSESSNDWEITPENATKKQIDQAKQEKERLTALAEKQVTDLAEKTDKDTFDETEIDPTDIELLRLWKRYRVAIKQVLPYDLNIIWPEIPS